MSIPTEPEPTKVAYYVPKLPAELWLLIFRFATSAHTFTPAPHDYDPFGPCPDTVAALSNAALRDKCALMLVCKQWRALALDTLYQDIRIGPGLSVLRAALCEAPSTVKGDDGAILDYAPRHRVWRAVLPYAHTATPTCDRPPALALLEQLPNLEVLVRPPHNHHHQYQQHQHHYDFFDLFDHDGYHFRPIHGCIDPFLMPALRFEFSTTTPAFPTLRRLEWAFDATGDATRAGGINALDDVLRAAPSLCELVLVGPMPLSALRQSPRQQLRTLHTLRLHGGAATCPFVARQTTYWALPALENVVVTGAGDAEALEALWEAHGSQVRVLEAQLGGTGAGGVRGRGALLSMTDVGKIVTACPKLEELNVRLSAEDFENSTRDSSEGDGAGVPRTWACAHGTLQRVGVCIDSGEWTAKTWAAVVEHVMQFEKGCPALRCVTLHVPDVGAAEEGLQFQALRETLMSSGRQLFLQSVHA